MVTFLEAVKDKVFDQQLEELVKGIYGIGEYRLVEYRWSCQMGFDDNRSEESTCWESDMH